MDETIEARSAIGRLSGLLAPVAIFLFLFILWKLAVLFWRVPPYLMPPPEAALAAIYDNAAIIGRAVTLTLRNAAAGLACAFLLAVTLATLFTQSTRVKQAVLPIVIGLRTAPVLAIAPILIMVFGRGMGASIAVVVIVSFFPIMVNAMTGLTATPANTLELMHVLGAGRMMTFIKVRLPFALPYLFTGLRSAATSAILAAMLAEWLSGAPGLGTMILDAASFRKTALLWAVVLVSMALALTIFALTSFIERKTTSWRQ